ncbi:MAG: patatin-like phospholipase family protein [Candidatus Omnitrophota bacterium]
MRPDFINKHYILKEIPLFADLSEREWDFIDKKTSLAEFRKNQIIYKEGSSPSGFYCIIFGRVVVYTDDRKGSEKILEYLSRGKYFGIISLLTGDPHSVTARAVNDCLILYMPKEAFMSTLKRIPRLAIDLSQTLSRRLKRKDVHQKTIFETTIISVSSASAKANRASYVTNLALSLKKETGKSVAVLEAVPQLESFQVPVELALGPAAKEFNLSHSFKQVGNLARFIIKEKTGIDLLCLRYNSNDAYRLRKIVNLLGVLVNDYHFIILSLPSFKEEFIFDILNQSNLIHVLSGPKPADLKRADRLRDRLRDELHFPSAKIRLIVDGEKPLRAAAEKEGKRTVDNIFAALPVVKARISRRSVIDNADCEYARQIRRIARNDGDCMVGLALGVGFAYGFCHVGVFKVLEEEKIPIDVISGSSMGALLASLWAIGRSSREIIEITRVFKEPKYIWSLVDLTFPFIGLIKGNKLYSFLKRCLGNKTFEDTRIPLKIVASDVKRKEWRILDKGLLIDAIMASCAMPGVFMPFKFREEMLCDGGVIMPMPTEPLVEIGVRKIIAVNVTPSREDVLRQFKQMKENAAGADKSPAVEKFPKKDAWYDLLLKFSLKDYVKDRLKTNILDIVFSSFEIMQSEMVNKEAQFADVVLHPDVGGLHWMELNKAEEFALRGEAEAKKHLDRMRALIKE